MGKQGWYQDWYQGSRTGNTLEPWHKPGTSPKWLRFILILSIFLCLPEYPCHSVYFPTFTKNFIKAKFYLFEKLVSRLSGTRNMGMEEVLTPGPNYNTPVKNLMYEDLLTSTFTQASHDRGIRTWRASVSYPQCVFYGNKFRYEVFNVEWHLDPNIGKTTIGKERTVAACKESLPTSCAPHRNRFLEVETEIRAHMASGSPLMSKKRNWKFKWGLLLLKPT